MLAVPVDWSSINVTGALGRNPDCSIAVSAGLKRYTRVAGYAWVRHEGIPMAMLSHAGDKYTKTYLVVKNDLEGIGVSADSLPSDGLSAAGVPFGIIIRAGDFDGINDGQERDSGDHEFGEHLCGF